MTKKQDNIPEKLARQQKLRKLINEKRNPFSHSFAIKQTVKEVCALEEKIAGTKPSSIEIRTAGRVLIIRKIGGIIFVILYSNDAEIQLIFSAPNSQLFSLANDLDRGDIIGVEGTLGYSQTKKLSVFVTKAQLLVKSLVPLPNKYHGLKDAELNLRNRHFSMITDKSFRTNLLQRSKIIHLIRHFLNQQNFLEVTTPILHDVLGGAAARPFITHHNSLNLNFYLRVAPELYLKRMIIGGFEKVYELGRVFRNEGISPHHNPEFTILEIYEAYGNMISMMNLTESIFRYVWTELKKDWKEETKAKFKDLKLSSPFERLSMIEVVKKYTNIDFSKVESFAAAQKLAKQHKVHLSKFDQTTGHVLNCFFENKVQAHIVRPTFIFSYPVEISPFAQTDQNNPQFTHRFELFIHGKEFANAFSELNDPIEQERRFQAQLKERQLGNEEANELDKDFLQAMNFGLPPTGGLGIGIDRLIMLFTQTNSIKNVLSFPTLKPVPPSSPE